MTRIDAWPGTKWNGQGQSRSLPQDWLSRALARIPLFEGLSKQDLRAVAGLADLRQYVDGVTVVRAGTPGDGMHVVLDGSAVVQPSAGARATPRARGLLRRAGAGRRRAPSGDRCGRR